MTGYRVTDMRLVVDASVSPAAVREAILEAVDSVHALAELAAGAFGHITTDASTVTTHHAPIAGDTYEAEAATLRYALLTGNDVPATAHLRSPASGLPFPAPLVPE